MKSDTTVDVAEARANLSRLIKRDSFAISRRGKVVGFYLGRERIEALIESMELLFDPAFHTALQELQSGKTRFYGVAELDAAMSR